MRSGDEIVSFNGRPIGASGDLATATGALAVGDPVRVRILRAGVARELAWTVPEYIEREARITDLPTVTARARRLRAALLNGR
jgi:S1-C subfamily serine protease